MTQGLLRLEKSLRATVENRPPAKAQEIFDAHLFARGMFEKCADIVNRGPERKMDRQGINRRVMDFIASRLNHGGRVPGTFSYRATVGRDGGGRLDLIEARVLDTRALIAYGFWTVAPRLALVDWRRYKTLKCRVCGRNFRDTRAHMGGKVMTTCSAECRKADRHKNRPKRRKPK